MRLPSGLAMAGEQVANPSIRRTVVGLALGLALLTACQPANVANPAIKLSATGSGPIRLTPNPNVPGDPENGRRLFTDSKFYPPNGCASCHTLRDVGTGAYPGAPNLTNVSLRATLADDALQNSPAQMKAWIMDPPGQKPGAKMPKLQVSDQEAEDLTAFIYSLPYNPAH
jgi:mono/diheme cytochrome c family protein